MSKPQASDLPAPFQFNAWKHHLAYVQDQLRQIKQTDQLRELLLILGTSVMDVYHGNLNLSQIQKELKGYLVKNEVYLKSPYHEWLNNSGYYVVGLSDGSQWTLRLGDIPAYYIHLHPARYSPHTFRLKANLFKTAIVLVWENKSFDLDTINHLRMDYLKLSPMKKIEPGLIKIVEMLRS